MLRPSGDLPPQQGQRTHVKLSTITSSSEYTYRGASSGPPHPAAASHSAGEVMMSATTLPGPGTTPSASDNVPPPPLAMAASAPAAPEPQPLAVPADAAAAASAAGVPDRCVISGSGLFSSCSREISGAQMHFNITVDIIKPQNYSQILIDRNISRAQVVDYLRRTLARPSGSCCR